jgi:small subunit ribosomal protein S20
MRNAIKAVDTAIATGSEEDAKSALSTAVPIIAKTASKGTIHKKNASRKVSRLTKRVNKMQATA